MSPFIAIAIYSTKAEGVKATLGIFAVALLILGVLLLGIIMIRKMTIRCVAIPLRAAKPKRGGIGSFSVPAHTQLLTARGRASHQRLLRSRKMNAIKCIWLFCFAALPYWAQAEPTLIEVMQSSAVAPLRMQERSVTAVFPGYFSGRRADAVVIHDEAASLCRGPDYRRCLPLGHLPTRRTIATTIKGESKLLVLDTVTSLRVCTVDARHSGAALDCSVVDQTKLADYNVTLMADGKLVQIEGTDGKYFCSDAGGQTSCAQITNADGSPALKMNHAERQIERQQTREHGTAFKPLDQPNKTCRVKKGEIRCDDKLSAVDHEDDLLLPVMKPVLLFDEDDDPPSGRWETQTLETVYITGSYDPGAPTDIGFWTGSGAYGGIGPRIQPPELPPNYYQKECLEICAQANIDYSNVCAISAGFALAFGPVIGGGYFVACEAGRAWHYRQCRGVCGS